MPHRLSSVAHDPMSRVILDSDEENSGDDEFDTSVESPVSPDGVSLEAATEQRQTAKRPAPDVYDVESPEVKRPRMLQQGHEEQNSNEQPSSTIMDSATPRLPSSTRCASLPAEHTLGDGDITFNEDDFEEHTSYTTPLNLAKDDTVRDPTTMTKATVVLSRPGNRRHKVAAAQSDREASPDELSSDVHTFSRRGRRKAAAGRSRSLGLDDEGQPVKHRDSRFRDKKGQRSASSDAIVRAHHDSLMDMGFRASQAESALLATGGDFGQALDHLCAETPANEHPADDPDGEEEAEAEAEVSIQHSEDGVSEASQPTEPSPKKRKPAKKRAGRKRHKESSVKSQDPADETVRSHGRQEKDGEARDQTDNEQTKGTPNKKLRPKRGRGRPKKETSVEEQDDTLDASVEAPKADVDAKACDADPDTDTEKSATVERGGSLQATAQQDDNSIREETADQDTARQGHGSPKAETEEMEHQEEHNERKTLGEMDANAAALPTEAAQAGDAQSSKLMLDNLVRTTPRLRLASGPLHRVGLSRRRPIQSLLRTIRK